MADQQVQGMLVQIEATTAQLRRELANADQLVSRTSQAIDRNLATVDSAFDRVGAAAQGAGTLMRGAFAAVAGAGLIGGIIKQVDAYGQMSDRMKAATGSAAEYQAVQEHLMQTAQETYRPLAEAQELYIRTADVMRSLGFNTQQTLDITDSFSFLLVTNAASADKASSALDAYSKALATGKVDADGWISIQTAMPTIVDAIARATGKSTDEVRKLGSEGKLALDDINIGLLKNVEVNRKAAADMSTSVQDALNNISNAIGNFLGKMEEQTGAIGGLSKVLVTLGENFDLVAVAIGGAGVAALTNYAAKTYMAVKAALAQQVAEFKNAQAAVRGAEAQRIYAQAQVQQAEASVAAATGLQRLSLVQTQLLPKQAALTASTEALTIAQANLTRAATGGLLTALGGPMGLAILAGTAAASFLLLRDNADQAGVSLDDLHKPVSQLREEFAKLNRDQREGALVDWTQKQVAAADAVRTAYGDLAQSIRQATVTAPARDSGGQYGQQLRAYQEVVDRLNEARASGGDLAPILREVGERLNLPTATVQQWITQSRAVSDADQRSGMIAETLRVLTGAMDENTASTQENNAAKAGMSTAGQAYLDTLQKQLAGLQDNGDMIKVVNRYLAEHTDLTETDRQAALSFANAIEAQKKANQGAKQETKDATSAQTKLTQQLKEAETAYQQLKKAFDPVGAASDEFQKQTKNLDLLLAQKKITTGEYGKALGALAEQFNNAVQASTGLSRAMKYQADLERQLAIAQQQGDAAAAAVGMGDKRAGRAQSRLALEQENNSKILALRDELATASTEKQRQELEKQIALRQEYGAKLVQVQEDTFVKIDAAQSDWTNGASAALENYLDSAADVAGQTQELFSNAFGNLEDGITQFVKTGKFQFKDFADSVIEDLIRIQVRQAAAGFLSSAFGFLGGGTQALGQGTMTGFSEVIPNAKGGVYDSPSLSAYSGGVYDSPQMFAFAKGAGVFAEAGPEAILPLHRGPDGSLGVMAAGAGGGGGSDGDPSISLGGITQQFYFGAGVDAATKADVKKAGREAILGAYDMMLRDFKTNGAGRQMLQRR
ncbi:phage tail tape measure protein [Pseudomonas asiatica]|uniref:phage tail tape measure protein n=1 Tax=Pseudomonas asiatica TaxID=2219225 RepID=UPI001E383B10|nr:phage tail tape measure protein [Pseudomonas asiatica]MCE1102202.1 phage tail tape measure protein [Pseudomonas asiatica]MCE1107755.1 phage tail tape measure protein [Pseudomonas asiatica]WJR21415.1 phage tail tape measure protein [Pseudomonas asiatica]